MAPEKMEVDEEDVKPSNVESEPVPKPKKKKKKKHRHKDKAKRRGDGVPSNNARDRRLLKALLEKLLTMVEGKDSNKFFAWPVTDQIAPGYSAIITRPMDFATMRNKLRTNGYSSFREFKNDFELLCNNAQTYNQSSTVYHKAARKLHHFGRKLMHTSKLLALKEDCPELAELTWEDLARDFQDVPVDSSAAPSGKEKTLDEDTDPARILEKAQQALKGVGTQLALRKAETTLSFLRQRGDGSTSLNIVVPPSKRTMEMEKTVTLGSAVGKLSHGTGTIQGFKEDRRNQAKIGKSLNYGAFSSHAPVYDTYFANVNANEGSMMLSAVYGSETSAHYADSLRRFCADSEYCLNVANDVLDVLTGGAHSEARMVVAVGEDGLTKVVEKKSNKEASGQLEQQEKKTDEEAKKVLYDFDTLRSLKDEGIDISFLDELENEEKEKATLETKLSSAGILLKDLKQTQDTRLSLPPPQHLSLCSGPSQEELNLARDVVTTLTDISRQVPPRMIAPVEGLRRAMGIEHPARSSVVN